MRARIIGTIAIVFALGGCVVGQSIEMGTPETAAVTTHPVNLEVTDARPYVVSGDKAPYYIGKYRAGFGIPYDVSTDGNVPLADVIAKDLTNKLQRFGASAQNARIKVDIRDWNFDSYQNGKFTYELVVTATPVDGAPETSETLKESIGVTGTFWTGGKGGFERDMPGIFEKVMTRVVAQGSVAYAALGGN